MTLNFTTQNKMTQNITMLLIMTLNKNTLDLMIFYIMTLSIINISLI
jgi:hypothetical protein